MILYLYSALLLQDARLTLKADAAVDGEYIALTDLVVDEGLPGDLRVTLATIYLGRAPERGQQRLITADDVRRELAWRGHGRVGVDGPAILVVREDPALVSTQETAASFAAQAIRRLAILELPGVAAADVVVRVTYLDHKRLPAGCEFARVAPRGPIAMGSCGFWLETRDGTVVAVVAKIGVLQTVAYARRELTRLQKISREDLDVRREEVDGTQGWVTTVDALVGGQALDKIRAGEPIKAASVKLRPVVRRGSIVAANGPYMTIEARALEDGAEGDVIACEFTGTKGPFQGRVLSGGSVHILGGK